MVNFFLRALMGRYFKYIFVGGSIAAVSGFIITGITGNEIIGGISGLVIGIGLIGLVLAKAGKAYRLNTKYYEEQNAKRNEFSNSLNIDKNKCMSCLQELDPETNTCPHCGFSEN